MPALYNLARTARCCRRNFALIGVGHAQQGLRNSWRDSLYAMLKSFVGNAAAEFDVDQHRRGCVEAACGEG